MNRRIHSIALLVGLIAFLGCTSTRQNLVKSGTVSVEMSPSKANARIFGVNVYQEGKEVVVSGRVKRRSAVRVTPRGHVDIAILSPKGKVIEKGSTSYVPRTIRRKSFHLGSHFTARFSVVPPDVSTVRLSYHAQGYSAAQTTFDCGENSAVNPG